MNHEPPPATPPLLVPDFFIAGVPKAGTTALHSALAVHPQLSMSTVKEPKYFLCDGRRPRGQKGPGDAHSAHEWIWRRDGYERLWPAQAGDALRGESTPFYFYDAAAQARIAATRPNARFIIVVRDPIDRAYSNWVHLWSDGLESYSRFEDACAAEPARIAGGWAPFWHYQRLGYYGEQLRNLRSWFPPEQIKVLRYRDLVDTPDAALDGICAFLGVAQGIVHSTPPSNTRRMVVDDPATRRLSKLVRTGAWAGAALPPRVWRSVSRPLVDSLHNRTVPVPDLDVDLRRTLVVQYADDIALLEELTGEAFSDWLSEKGRGTFARRQGADSRP